MHMETQPTFGSPNAGTADGGSLVAAGLHTRLSSEPTMFTAKDPNASQAASLLDKRHSTTANTTTSTPTAVATATLAVVAEAGAGRARRVSGLSAWPSSPSWIVRGSDGKTSVSANSPLSRSPDTVAWTKGMDSPRDGLSGGGGLEAPPRSRTYSETQSVRTQSTEGSLGYSTAGQSHDSHEIRTPGMLSAKDLAVFPNAMLFSHLHTTARSNASSDAGLASSSSQPSPVVPRDAHFDSIDHQSHGRNRRLESLQIRGATSSEPGTAPPSSGTSPTNPYLVRAWAAEQGTLSPSNAFSPRSDAAAPASPAPSSSYTDARRDSEPGYDASSLSSPRLNPAHASALLDAMGLGLGLTGVDGVHSDPAALHEAAAADSKMTSGSVSRRNSLRSAPPLGPPPAAPASSPSSETHRSPSDATAAYAAAVLRSSFRRHLEPLHSFGESSSIARKRSGRSRRSERTSMSSEAMHSTFSLHGASSTGHSYRSYHSTNTDAGDDDEHQEFLQFERRSSEGSISISGSHFFTPPGSVDYLPLAGTRGSTAAATNGCGSLSRTPSGTGKSESSDAVALAHTIIPESSEAGSGSEAESEEEVIHPNYFGYRDEDEEDEELLMEEARERNQGMRDAMTILQTTTDRIRSASVRDSIVSLPPSRASMLLLEHRQASALEEFHGDLESHRDSGRLQSHADGNWIDDFTLTTHGDQHETESSATDASSDVETETDSDEEEAEGQNEVNTARRQMMHGPFGLHAHLAESRDSWASLLSFTGQQDVSALAAAAHELPEEVRGSVSRATLGDAVGSSSRLYRLGRRAMSSTPSSKRVSYAGSLTPRPDEVEADTETDVEGNSTCSGDSPPRAPSRSQAWLLRPPVGLRRARAASEGNRTPIGGSISPIEPLLPSPSLTPSPQPSPSSFTPQEQSSWSSGSEPEVEAEQEHGFNKLFQTLSRQRMLRSSSPSRGSSPMPTRSSTLKSSFKTLLSSGKASKSEPSTPLHSHQRRAQLTPNESIPNSIAEKWESIEKKEFKGSLDQPKQSTWINQPSLQVECETTPKVVAIALPSIVSADDNLIIHSTIDSPLDHEAALARLGEQLESTDIDQKTDADQQDNNRDQTEMVEGSSRRKTQQRATSNNANGDTSSDDYGSSDGGGGQQSTAAQSRDWVKTEEAKGSGGDDPSEPPRQLLGVPGHADAAVDPNDADTTSDESSEDDYGELDPSLHSRHKSVKPESDASSSEDVPLGIMVPDAARIQQKLKKRVQKERAASKAAAAAPRVASKALSRATTTSSVSRPAATLAPAKTAAEPVASVDANDLASRLMQVKTSIRTESKPVESKPSESIKQQARRHVSLDRKPASIDMKKIDGPSTSLLRSVSARVRPVPANDASPPLPRSLARVVGSPDAFMPLTSSSPPIAASPVLHQAQLLPSSDDAATWSSSGVSGPSLIQHKVYIITKQRYVNVEIIADARARDLVAQVMDRAAVNTDDSTPGGWVIFDVSAEMGIGE